MIEFKCDMCGKKIPECNVTVVAVHRPTDNSEVLGYELCPSCAKDLVGVIDGVRPER